MLFFNRRVILEEEVVGTSPRSIDEVVNNWSRDQKIKAEVRQAVKETVIGQEMTC